MKKRKPRKLFDEISLRTFSKAVFGDIGPHPESARSLTDLLTGIDKIHKQHRKPKSRRPARKK